MSWFMFVYREDCGAEKAELEELPSIDEARVYALLTAHMHESKSRNPCVTAVVSEIKDGEAVEAGRWRCLESGGWTWLDAGLPCDGLACFTAPAAKIC